MGFLKQIENRMESLVEGVFGRAFRRQVHPVEIAKGLTRQMNDGRMVSVSRTYAPNDFTIHLSEQDAESIQAYQEALREELIQYASAHAEDKSYHLMTPPRIHFEVEDSLRFGEFGITAKLTGPSDGSRERGAPQDTSGETRIFRTESKDQGQENKGNAQENQVQETSAIDYEEAAGHGLASEEVVELVVGKRRMELSGRGPWGVGRSQENELVVEDPNVSRKHARISRANEGFVVEDLGSTNGTLLDGAPIDRERIDNGDELTFGQSKAQFIRRSGTNGASGAG